MYMYYKYGYLYEIDYFDRRVYFELFGRENRN